MRTWQGAVLALALAGCEACSEAAPTVSPPSIAAPRWPAPHIAGPLVLGVHGAALAASGAVVVVEVDAPERAASELVAFDVAQRTIAPVFPPQIDGARVLTAALPARGVSADGRYVATICATAGATALEHAVCVRDRRGGAHLVRGPTPAALASADVWLSGDGSTLVVQSVEPGRTRIFRAARGDAALHELFARETSAGGAHDTAPRVLDVAHDGAVLLGEARHRAGDVIDLRLVRGEAPPRPIAAELAPLEARFASRDGATIDLVLDQGGELPIRRPLELASGSLGEPRPLDDRGRRVSSPTRVARLDGRTLHIEGEGEPREVPLPAGLQDLRLRAVADDGHVLATAAIGARTCLVLLGGGEPLVIGCAE